MRSTWWSRPGDAGPTTPVGINLPNDSFVREHHGSKSVSLSNISEAYEKSTATGHAHGVFVDAGRSGAH